MEEQILRKDIHVSELFKHWPDLVSFFLDQKMGCVGCSLMRFCTLEDVAIAYELDRDGFIAALNAYVQAQDDEKTSTGKG